MVFDAAVVIRAASGGLFVLLGLAIPFLGRWTRRSLWLAGLLVAFGAVIVINNIGVFGTLGDVYLATGLYVIAGVCGMGVAFEVPPRLESVGWRELGYGLVVGFLSATGLFSHGFSRTGFSAALGLSSGPDGFWLILASLLIGVAGLSGMVAVGSLRIARRAPSNRAGWVRAASPVFILGPSLVFQRATDFSSAMSVWSFIGSLALVVGVTMPWLVAAKRSGHRFAVAMALLWPALGLASYLYVRLPVNRGDAFYDAFGVYGILRLLEWAFLAYAILRVDLLGVPLPRFVVHRGAVAAGALATLFIVAQVAQNFFSAKFGLLTGGIVAGTFLFAASPVQKAMERMGERRSTTPAARHDAGAEKLYRDALRFALKDGALSHEEDLHLAELGERLGISARRAREMRLVVEGERGAL